MTRDQMRTAAADLKATAELVLRCGSSLMFLDTRLVVALADAILAETPAEPNPVEPPEGEPR